MPKTIVAGKTLTSVDLRWDEVYYTNCPLVSASQRRPGAGLDQGGVQEDRRPVPVPPLAQGERLVPALRPQPRQPDPLRRPVPAHPRHGRHPPDAAAGRDACAARGRRHDGALPRRHLPDGRPEGQEDRPLAQPEHGQDRLVGHPGGAGHRADAPAQRHDPQGRADRRVPVPGRLVRQARDDGPGDGEPVGAVAAARPQARPGVPAAGDGPREGRHRRDVHADRAAVAAVGGNGEVQVDRGPGPVSGLDAPGGQHPRRHHVLRRHGREAPRARRHVHEGDDQGRPLGQRAQARRGGDPRQADVLPGRRRHVRGHQAHRHGAEPVAEEPPVGRYRQAVHAEPRLHQERLRRAEVGRAGVPRAGREGTARTAVEEDDHGETAGGDRTAVRPGSGSGSGARAGQG